MFSTKHHLIFFDLHLINIVFVFYQILLIFLLIYRTNTVINQQRKKTGKTHNPIIKQDQKDEPTRPNAIVLKTSLERKLSVIEEEVKRMGIIEEEEGQEAISSV